MLANLLNRLAEMRLETRDFTLNAIRGALLELVASFPVYRSYVTPEHIGRPGPAPHRVGGCRRAAELRRPRRGLFDFVRRLLLNQLPGDADAAYRAQSATFPANSSSSRRR